MGTLDLMLRDYRLTTAEILYHMPDHEDLLQSYLWQDLDHIPDLPRLKAFLDFWQDKLDGRLHSVRVAAMGLIEPATWRYSSCELTLH